MVSFSPTFMQRKFELLADEMNVYVARSVLSIRPDDMCIHKYCDGEYAFTLQHPACQHDRSRSLQLLPRKSIRVPLWNKSHPLAEQSRHAGPSSVSKNMPIAPTPIRCQRSTSLAPSPAVTVQSFLRVSRTTR
jgi:hypothetical protein